jgi:hypothetical protein
MTDDPKIWAAFVAGGLSLLGTIYATIMGHIGRREQDRVNADTAREMEDHRARTNEKLAVLNAELQAERDERLAERESEKVVSRFRDPLLHAAYDFQSRIYNILSTDYLGRYYTNGTPRESAYAIENTVFLLSQFLGWTELIREEIQFLDLGSEEHTRQLRTLQDRMFTQLHTEKLGTGFRLFPGEQRIVGELMIDRSSGGARCVGFAPFRRSRPAQLDELLDPLRDDLKAMAANVAPYEDRLTRIQHSLIDLLHFLDEDYVWFPESSRKKL